MKKMVILSGKGGTGKTSVTAALAHLASQHLRLMMVDADVDASNLELVLAPSVAEEHPFMGGQIAVIEGAKCTCCGRCHQVCRFDAILPGNTHMPFTVDSAACEGCAACATQCPVDAISLQEQQAGIWFRSETLYGPLFHACLYAGKENSGKLVTTIRMAARKLGDKLACDLLLIDGPPGIGCPVIAASSGVDLALMVAEPSLSGAHDLERVLATARHFRVPAFVLINKADLNPAQTRAIGEICVALGVPLLGTLPYDDSVTLAMVQGVPVTAFRPLSDMTIALKAIWRRLRRELGLQQGSVEEIECKITRRADPHHDSNTPNESKSFPRNVKKRDPPFGRLM